MAGTQRLGQKRLLELARRVEAWAFDDRTGVFIGKVSEIELVLGNEAVDSAIGEFGDCSNKYTLSARLNGTVLGVAEEYDIWRYRGPLGDFYNSNWRKYVKAREPEERRERARSLARKRRALEEQHAREESVLEEERNKYARGMALIGQILKKAKAA